MAETDQNTTEIEIKLYNHYIYRFIWYQTFQKVV